jgi:gliding motility-associated-like protein
VLTGCDSIVTLNLIVLPITYSTTNVTNCSNQLPYLWNGTNYNFAGIFTTTLTNQHGCDSIATLNLTVNPVTTSTNVITICDNQLPFSWNSLIIPAAGNYSVTLTNQFGCDSIANLTLNVDSVSYSTTNVTICSNQAPYIWSGNAYNASGTYSITLTGQTGCDSIATLNLTINPVSTSTTTASVCSNQLPYFWNGTNYNFGGIFTATLTNQYGCDSIATLILTVNPTSTSATNVTVCSNQLPYLWNGTNYNFAGIFTTTLTNQHGCDSIATLNLTVNPVTTSTNVITICDNQLPFSWNSLIIPAAGNYSVTLTNQFGCDSIANLTLNVDSVSYSTTNVTICSNQAPYIWSGNAYNASGTYSITLTGQTGCDSIATLNLTINPVSTSTTTASVCSNQLPYFWNGTNYNFGGIFTATLTNQYGCDSIATLILTVNPTSTSATNVTVCSNQLPYLWNGTNYNFAGIFTTTLTNQHGCDSIATLNLTVNPVTTSTNVITICDNQLPFSWNSLIIPAAGNYSVTLTNQFGCDSIANLTLNVDSVSYSTTNVTICSNQAPYIWSGNAYNASGTYSITLTGQTGCDSIATLNLTINPVSTSTTTASVCSNQLPYFWNGTNYNFGGIFTATLTNQYGCDSIATLVLTVNPTSTSTTNVTVCSNQLPYNWNGTNYNFGGAFTTTLTNQHGCDSIATLNLTVNPVSTSSNTITICNNQLPFSWNGLTIPGAGNYSVTLTNQFGCDSIANLTLNVDSVSYSTTNVTICSNQAPYTWNGNIINTSGTYTYQTVNSAGCDSIATLNITINPVSTSTTNITVCSNQLPYLWNGTNYNFGGTFTATLTNQYGCDSIATLNLTVNPTSTSTTNIIICSTQLPYTWNGNNYNFGGTFTVTLTNQYGCDSIATLNLTVNPVTSSSTTITICDNQLPFSWNSLTITGAGTYTDTLTSVVTGCDSIVELVLNVDPTLFGFTTAVICETDTPFTWNNQSYSVTGIYVDTLISQSGCDSIATLDLTVNPTLYGSTTAVICDSDTPFVWNGINYSTTGIYIDTLVSIATGCDSIVTLDLTVNPTLYGSTVAVICDTDTPFVWNGINYSITGIYTDTLISQTGCDSIVTLDLTVNPTLFGSTTAVICDTDTPYVWNGINYSITGIYIDTLISQTGCDSIVTLDLTVNPTLYGSTTAVICDTDTPFVWNGNNYSITGIYTDTLISQTGCDSIVTLDLTINPTLYGFTSAIICDTDTPFVWNGINYSITGIYVDTLISQTGCDSIVTLDLTVNPTLYGNTTAVICDTDTPFVWNGNGYSSTGIYTDTLTSISTGCDSIVTLNLTVNPTLYSSTTLTICDNQLPITWNTLTITAAGTYYDTLSSLVTGCDSIAELILNVDPTLYGSTIAVICDTDTPFVWNGLNYSVTGIYIDTLISMSGCDSIVTLDLTVNPTLFGQTTIIICDNQTPYIWNGNPYNLTGIFMDTLISQTGCDSIVTLDLTVNPVTTSTTTDTICDDALPYAWNGNNYLGTGIYQVTFTNQYGCDSIAILDLTVNPVTYSTTWDTICNNQSLTWNGTTYINAGTYSTTLVNQYGCDSIATLILHVNPVTYSLTIDTICFNDLPYVWNGNNYNIGGIYVVTLVNQFGCDSVATLDLLVDPVGYSTTYDTICNNQFPYIWGGNAYTAAGTYVDTLQTTWGCDSLATLVLHVNPVTYSTTWDTICDNQTYTWNGNTYTLAGTYTHTLVNQYGCDSVATLMLHVNPVTYSTNYDTICNNQSLTWNGTAYTTAGTYTATLVNQYGCDSVATLHLHVNPVTYSLTIDTICFNDLPYVWNGNNYNAGGIYVVTLVNQYGCDSVATLDLLVDPVGYSTTYDTICDNQFPYIWGGNSYWAAGTYVDSLKTAWGCDSLATLILHVNPVTYSTTLDTICDNQTYTWNGNTYTLAGTYTHTLVNQYGCDSVATLNLHVNPVTYSTNHDTICDNQSLTWNGTTYTVAGTYSATLVNQYGCDSIATLYLHVNPVTYSLTTDTVCFNDLPYIWNGNNYNVAGIYVVTLVNQYGCDSVATLNLTVDPVGYSTTTVTICHNQLPYQWGGNFYFGAGTYVDSLHTTYGCDSLATLILNVNPLSYHTVNVTICQGDLWWAGGAFQTTTGIYMDTLVNSYGCDSILTTNLTVNPTTYSYHNPTICQGDSVFAGGGFQTTTGTYYDTLVNYLNCDSVVITNLTVIPTAYNYLVIRICQGESYFVGGAWQTTPGTYYDTLVSSQNCDSVIITTLDIYPTVYHSVYVDICHGESYYAQGAWQTATGVYTDTLLSWVGCDSIIITNLTVHPNPVAQFSVNPGTTTIRFPTIAFTDNSIGAQFWQWNFGEPPSGINNFSALQNPFHEYLAPGTYTIWLVVSDSIGCTDSTFRRVIIEDVPLIYVPNAFTPDGDGLNDIFIPKGYLNEWDFYEFSIYNRFGQMLFITNDVFEGWNGTYRGELSPQGVYAWKLQVRHKPGDKIITLDGTVTLLR